MNQVTFELYLLSRLRADEEVAEALRGLGLTRSDAERAAASAAAYGFEETVQPVRLYREALGPPVSTEPDASLAADSPFAGSNVLRFGLRNWPGFEYVVRETPSGYAWGMGFDRAKGSEAPRLSGVADLRPWRFVESEVTAALGRPLSVDAWSGWEDLCYTAGQPPRRYLLQFDLNLLQTVSPFDEPAT